MNPKFYLGCSWEGFLNYGKIICYGVGKGRDEHISESKLCAELHTQGTVLLEILHTLICS